MSSRKLGYEGIHLASSTSPRLKQGLLAAVLVVILTFLNTACGGSVRPGLNYQPVFLPVHLSVSSSGVAIGGDTSLVTPIGTFSIGASYLLPRQNDGIYVILRNRKTGYDHIFDVRTGGDHLTAVINGRSIISVSGGQVLIDVTSGRIKKITFRQVRTAISEQSDPGIWHAVTGRWDTGWRQSWYKPFAMSRWAYSDSTIGEWFGVGFIWFLLRLLLAVVLGFIDLVLTIGFLLGQIAFLVFGPTGRDVVYGLIVLLFLGIVTAAWFGRDYI